jgi:hypothetical protein
MQVTTIGLDLAKHVFQIHGIDAAEKVVVRKQLRFTQACSYPDGAQVYCLSVLELRDGLIARQTAVQAWDE